MCCGCPGGAALSEVRHIQDERDGACLHALLARRTGPPLTISYCNQSRTIEGGSHVDGAMAALSDFPADGLVVLLDVRLHDPDFAGRTRGQLNMPRIAPIIAAMIRDAL
ncbi:MAG: DNA gyrase/topoisomerase IV subunit B [Myxococcota bacterium]